MNIYKMKELHTKNFLWYNNSVPMLATILLNCLPISIDFENLHVHAYLMAVEYLLQHSLYDLL